MRSACLILTVLCLSACSSEYGNKVAVFSKYIAKSSNLEACKKNVYQRYNALPSHVVSITHDTPELFSGFYDPRITVKPTTLDTGIKTRWVFYCKLVTDETRASAYWSVPFYDTQYYKWRGRD